MSRRDRADSPEDLSVLARRGLLSQSEIDDLELELRVDASVDLAHTVGLDLDRSTAVRAGDEALIARAADAALGRVRASGLADAGTASRQPGATAKTRRIAAVLLAAALVTITGAAAAMLAGIVPRPWFAMPAPSEPVKPANAKIARVHAAAEAPEAADPSPPETAPAESATDAEARAARTAHAAQTHMPESTAPELFKNANAARRAGDFERARRLYSDLIARHPASDEARLARVSLGKLLLARGDTAEAERTFNEYLNDGRGQLAEEALVNRAQSLRKLGRTTDERVTWQRLLAEYPNSVYAGDAKGRLEALGRETTAPAR